MGVVDELLTEFELADGAVCRIEMNATGVIHLHLDRFRLEFSPSEFEHFVELIRDAQETLREMKQLDGV